MVISNKYKDTLDDFISSDIKLLDWLDFPNRPKLIDKGSQNVFKSRGGSRSILQENYLDKDVSVTSLEPMLKIWVF